jgi:hypothetical protein
VPKSSHITEEVDALFELRPGEFVAARDALAKRLRGHGQRADAAEVRALARPTVAAWAVNQLARREPEWTQALATAGQRLERAHQQLLRRGDRDGWRAATSDQRQAIDRLVRLAEQVLREERGSVSVSLRDQVRQTLQAATLDPDARAAVLAGRLTRELRSGGSVPGQRGRAVSGPGGGGPARATADAQGRFPRPAPGTKGDPATGRGRITGRTTTTGAEAEAATGGTTSDRAGNRPAAGEVAKQDRAAPASKATRPASRPAKAEPASTDRPSVREAARTARANRASAEREARALRRAAEREARATLRRVERERTTADVAAERADQAFERARKSHEAAVDALAEAEQAARERAAELSIAEDARSEARAMLAAREAAVAEARAELHRVTSG